MSLRSPYTIDHFKKHGQLLVPRAHYELHFDEPGNEELYKLAKETSVQIFDKLPEDCFYRPIPMTEELSRAHLTKEEVSDYEENELLEYDRQIEEEVLADMDVLKLEIGRELMVGEDGLLFSIDPVDQLVALREEIRRILGRSPNPEKIPHVTAAYSKMNADTREVCRLVDNAQIHPATVSVSGLTRVMQWSNGSYYSWDDEKRIFLPFGRRK